MKEMSALRLLTIHNLHYILDLVDKASAAVQEGRYAEFVREVRAARSGGWAEPSTDA
jgi:tRNA-guanine family transglycosylase